MIVLVGPSEEYAWQAAEFIQELRNAGSEIHGTGRLEEFTDNYAGWLKVVGDYENGRNMKDGHVRASTYFAVREEDGRIVGMMNIRHELNDFLLERGGHIGYSVRPSERRKGYATEILRLGLDKCAELGMKKVLITCDKDNIGSARTIQKNGGVLENEVVDVVDSEKLIQRYWIVV